MPSHLSKSFDSFIRQENKKKYYEERDRIRKEREKENDSSRVCEETPRKKPTYWEKHRAVNERPRFWESKLPRWCAKGRGKSYSCWQKHFKAV